MAFLLKKFKKKPLTLITIALLSAPTLSQAFEMSSSSIKLCVQETSFVLSEAEYLNQFPSGHPDFENYDEYHTVWEKEIIETNGGLQEDLRAQTYASVQSKFYGYSLQPRLVKSQAVIINYDDNFNYINAIYEQKSAVSATDSYGSTNANLTIRSLGHTPNQVIGAATTISAPGQQFRLFHLAYPGDIPPIRSGFKTSCSYAADEEWSN